MNHEISANGEFAQSLLLFGYLDPETITSAGSFKTKKDLEALSLEERLSIKCRIADAASSELEPYWEMGLKSIILHGDEVFAALDPERFDFKKFAEESTYLAVLVYKPVHI